MPERVLVPSIEQRLAGLLEVTRRRNLEAEQAGARKPAITISREYGCEAYPVAERLKALAEERTKQQWAVVDRGLLAEVARSHDLSETVLQSLGKRPRFLDDMMSMLSPRWKNDADYYRLLCNHIISVATGGHVIIVGMGAAVLTQYLDNCHHFRIFGSMGYKTQSIARRSKIPHQEAELLIERKQRERDSFIRDFLSVDPKDLSFYHLAFNNDRNSPERMARIIGAHIFD